MSAATASAPAPTPSSASPKSKARPFVIARSQLAEALAGVMPVVPTKSTLPVLASVHVAPHGAGVRLTATNLDQTAARTVAAECPADAQAFVVPAKRLAEIVTQLPEGPVHLQPTTGAVQVRAGRASFRLTTDAAANFPQETRAIAAAPTAMTVAALLQLVERSAFAASTEESRPILQGVLVSVGATAVRLVATNGHRLALVEAAREGASADLPALIVPPSAFDAVRRLFAPEETVTLSVDDATTPQALLIASDRAELRTRLIEGPYPPYQQVIPRDEDLTVRAVGARSDFLAALKRVMPLASTQTSRVKLTLAGGRMLFNVETPDMGSAEDEAPIQFDGTTIAIGVNGAYLREILSRLPDGDVRWRLSTPERAMVLEPAEAGPDCTRLMYLLMPLRLVD